MKRIFFFLLIAATYLSGGLAIEASFTPAPDKDTGTTDGPLPLSQNQRNQLLQLEQQIAQSPNPNETLQKVAEANGMQAQELGDLLMRNRRDMQMANGGGGGSMGMVDSLPRKMIRLMSTFVMLTCKSATLHPRSATIITLAVFSIMYIMYSAPRSGIVISGGPGILSSGFTTVLSPPTEYLSKYLTADKFHHLKESKPGLEDGKLSQVFACDEEEDGVHVAKLSKKEKKKFSLCVSAKKTVPFELLLPSEEELELMHEKELKTAASNVDDEDLMSVIEEKAWEDSIDLAFKTGESIIAARRFSEFISSSPNSIRFVARGGTMDKAALVVKSMGDWKRYGVQPLRVAREENSEGISSVIYYTLKGGHFDGEFLVSVEKNDGEDPSVHVTVTLLIPKGGRKISTKLASNMVSMLANSITTSTMTTARQTLSRRLQSTIYRGKAKTRATEKRQVAFENIQKMEEMAADRRRRWQRSNEGSGGSYRPTGFRRPEGSPSRGFRFSSLEMLEGRRLR